MKGGLSVFASLRQSEVILEMILQLNLYIIKQIPYLCLKIVYHLFYSINLELKLDGLEFNSQNIWFILLLLLWKVVTLAVLGFKHFILTWRALHSTCGVYIIKYCELWKMFSSIFSRIFGSRRLRYSWVRSTPPRVLLFHGVMLEENLWDQGNG